MSLPTPAGWFADPEDPASLRYWDGAAWTDHRHPAAAVSPYGAGAPTIPYAPLPRNTPAVVGLVLGIVGTVLGLAVSLFVLLAVAGGVVSIVGLVQANRMRAAGLAGDRRGLSIAGIAVGFGGVVLSTLGAFGYALYIASTYPY